MPKKVNPNAMHRDRVREKYLKGGLDILEDHEVLEMLLFYAIPQHDTKKIARRVLDEFGDLYAVFEAHPDVLQKKGGLTKNTAVLLNAILPLYRRINLNKWKSRGRIKLDSSAALGEYVKQLFIGETRECFYLLCLDSRLRLIIAEMLDRGTIDRTTLYPREMAEAALRCGASYVVLTHNHPSGNCEISPQDYNTTIKIMKVFESIEISVLDHFVVGSESYASFNKNRLLNLIGIEGAIKELEEQRAEARKQRAKDKKQNADEEKNPP